MVSSDNFSNCVQMASPNKALDFDGTNDYVDVGDFSLGGSLTFEAWMQYDSRALGVVYLILVKWCFR